VKEAEELLQSMSGLLSAIRNGVPGGEFEIRKLLGAAFRFRRYAENIEILSRRLKARAESPRKEAKVGSVFILKSPGGRKPGGRWGSAERHH
jgi:hypothetical protein